MTRGVFSSVAFAAVFFAAATFRFQRKDITS
jgi:ABC-type transport system involved in multi-copper enzyme maturation permease subunit